MLTETWCRADVDTHCPPGYAKIVLRSQKQKHVKHGRDSGGVIWYREGLASQLTQMKKGPTYIWLKLKKIIVTTTCIFMQLTLPP